MLPPKQSHEEPSSEDTLTEMYIINEYSTIYFTTYPHINCTLVLPTLRTSIPSVVIPTLSSNMKWRYEKVFNKFYAILLVT